MILVRRWIAVLLCLIAVGSLIALGIAGYRQIGSGAAASGADAKANSELFLYGALVAATVLVFALIVLAGRTEYITRELDKMVALNRYGDFSPEVSMKKLGRIGEKITLLYFRLNALNDKRSLKISALSDLVQLLINNVDVSLLVTDVTGTPVYANKQLAERLGLTRSELMNTNIGDVLEGSTLQDIITQLDRTNASYELTSESEPILVIPVDNRMNELSYIVWSFDRDGFSTVGTDRPDRRTHASGMQGMLRRMFARSYGKRSGR